MFGLRQDPTRLETVLLATTTLGWKVLPGVNIQAYLAHSKVIKEKCFFYSPFDMFFSYLVTRNHKNDHSSTTTEAREKNKHNFGL
jgi:hypothetical protein